MTESSEKTYSLAEVAKHNSNQSSWIIIHNEIYDVTKFLNEVSKSTYSKVMVRIHSFVLIPSIEHRLSSSFCCAIILGYEVTNLNFSCFEIVVLQKKVQNEFRFFVH